MQVYDLIVKIREDGTLLHLVKSGIISSKVTTYADIYGRVEALRLRRKRASKKQLILQVADEYNIHPTTVYRAVKVMRYTVTPVANTGK